MDIMPYVFGALGTVICALTAIAYNKPNDYLEVFHPGMKTILYMAVGGVVGATIANSSALSMLMPLIDMTQGGRFAVAKVQLFPTIAMLICGACLIVELGLWLLAHTMQRRLPLPPAAP